MALSANSPERGSVILFLFIAVALFGALAFAFTQGSRSSVTMLENEQGKASATATQDCTNTVNLAVKRLELRGCGNKISYLADGSNANADAPSDGSCSVFHPNGGGAKACNASAIVPFDITTLLPGEAGGGVIYLGTAWMGGYRIYTTPTDQPGTYTWNKGVPGTINLPGADSISDGLANTNTIVAATNGESPYLAANSCRALGPEWYMPSVVELMQIISMRNTGAMVGTIDNAAWYISSTEESHSDVTARSSTAQQSMNKSVAQKVRCVRRD